MRTLRLALLGTALVSVATVTSASSPPVGKTRTYYIAADEVPWDYLPGGRDEIAGRPFTDSAYFQHRPGWPRGRPVSTVYKKALYREYTDGSFTTLKPRDDKWIHLGFLGPILHAEVGDTIRVVFKNSTDHPNGVHPHGVFYAKDSEGAPYQDGTSGADKADDAVPPGGTHTYVWPVPERAGPGPNDPSSVMWMYHSHTNEVEDVNTGLLGVMVVTARGKARPDGSPADVDRELVMDFAQVHEDDSWYAAENIGAVGDSVTANPSVQSIYPYFVKFSINGFVHGAMPLSSVTIKRGERVRWYVLSSTNDFDFHTPHWHGNTVMVNKMRMDVTALEPMEMIVADMVPDNPGIWLFHCHVSAHLAEGMQIRYRVTD